MNNGRKINLLHFINSLEVAGAEKNLLSIVKGHDKKSFNTFIAYSLGGPLEEQFQKTDSFLYKFQSSKVRFRDFRNITLVPKLTRFIKEHKIDIIHAHAFVPHFWGLVAAKLTSIPIIRHIHGFELCTRSNINIDGVIGHFWLAQRLVSLTDLNIVITASMKEELLERGIDAQKIRLIPNGIELPNKKTFLEAQRAKGNIRNEFDIANCPIICTVGRLAEQKNQQLLLKSCSGILRQFPTTKFLIVGDGPIRSELEELSKDLGLTGSIVFAGYREDVYSFLAACDIFVLPSLWELHPISILEAMAMRKPVIASAVGGIPDTVVHGKTGLLIPPNDESALKDAIIQLLRDKGRAERMGMEGYEHVKENFSNGKVVKKIENLYREVLSKRKLSGRAC